MKPVEQIQKATGLAADRIGELIRKEISDLEKELGMLPKAVSVRYEVAPDARFDELNNRIPGPKVTVAIRMEI